MVNSERGKSGLFRRWEGFEGDDLDLEVLATVEGRETRGEVAEHEGGAAEVEVGDEEGEADGHGGNSQRRMGNAKRMGEGDGVEELSILNFQFSMEG
jgi:hypothetical protein